MPPAADGERVRPSPHLVFAHACAAASRPALAAAAPLSLPAAVAQGLADVLPTLMCGEASAEVVFGELPAALPSAFDPALRDALRGIAEDEHRHGAWLAELRLRLPPPTAREPARRAVRFLQKLFTPDPALHLSRVSALDGGVCVVLAEIGRHGAPLAADPMLARLFARIRRDEGRHVRIGRACATALGIDARAALGERRRVLEDFGALLQLQSAAFAVLGVDTEQLRRRFRRVAARSPIGR